VTARSANFLLLLLALPLSACGPSVNRYALIEESLRAGDVQRADAIVESAQSQYNNASQVLYRMDRGMTLHLAGRYEDSTAVLEKADQEVEQLYTRRISTDVKAMLYNDSVLPYEGATYEQVMLNIIKALNYALAGRLSEALVEARRVDHRLNVLSDQAGEKPDTYRDDAFARYLSGVLFEAAGELNDAFIAYRKAFAAYGVAQAGARTPTPLTLRTDLLRITDALRLTEEHDRYRQSFPNLRWQPDAEAATRAQIVIVGYHGRAPYKQDQLIDLPISKEALTLVLLNKTAGKPNSQEARVDERTLVGLSGQIVRVALPQLILQKTRVAYDQISVVGQDQAVTSKTELAQDVSALAAREFSEQFSSIAVRAVARVALKYALAEGVKLGAQAAAGRDAGPLVGLIVGGLAKAMANATEVADTRSWRTLPDEIKIARLWVPVGTYEVRIQPMGQHGGQIGREVVKTVTLRSGETTFITDRVME